MMYNITTHTHTHTQYVRVSKPSHRETTQAMIHIIQVIKTRMTPEGFHSSFALQKMLKLE